MILLFMDPRVSGLPPSPKDDREGVDPRVSGLRPSPKDDTEERSPKGDREGVTKEGTSFSVMLAKASIQGNVFFMPTAF